MVSFKRELSFYSLRQVKVVLFTLCLGLPLTAHADQLDPGLVPLFQQMQRTRSPIMAVEIENSIWQIWLSHENPEFNALMESGVQAMNQNSMYEALDIFDQLIELAPNYSEAWNKRATIYYILEEFENSKADIDQTLLLEPKHFGALSGLGLIYMAQGEYYLARDAFNSAIEINPFLSGVIDMLNQLEVLFNRNTLVRSEQNLRPQIS